MAEENTLSIGWCVIPPYIMNRPDLSSNEKLLYGRILGLSDKEGYCFASNEWLGQQIGLEGRSVRAIIAKLKVKGLIDVEVDLKLVSQRRIYPLGETSVRRGGVIAMTPQGGIDMTPSKELSETVTNTSSKEDGQARGMKKLSSVLEGLNIRHSVKLPTDNRLSNGWQYYALEVVKLAGFTNGESKRIFSVFKQRQWGHFQVEKAKEVINHKNYKALTTEKDRVSYLIGAFRNSA